MDQRISGRTKLLGLFGTPVGHSGSPAMYNFSFWHDNIDCAYLAFVDFALSKNSSSILKI